jgi:hypothetical protein
MYGLCAVFPSSDSTKIKQIPRRNLFDYMSIGEGGIIIFLSKPFTMPRSQKTNNGDKNRLEKSSSR